MSDINNILTPEEAERKIQEIATYADIIPAYHYYEKGLALRNYSLQDVRHALKNGKIVDPPEYDDFYRNWEYNVEGRTIDGDEVIAVVVIINHRTVKVITIKPKE